MTEHERERAIDELAQVIVDGGMSRGDLLRRGAVLGLSGAAVASLASDAVASSGQVSGTISVVANTGAGAEDKAWHDRTNAFMKKFPGVKVKPDVTVGETFYALLPKVTTMIAGGRAPYCLRVGNYTTALFAEGDALLPLDDFIKNDPDVKWNDFIPRAKKAMSYQGKVYALPENNESYGIHYNATAVKKAGLPDPRKLWEAGKWDKAAFLRTAQKLTSGDGASKKFGFLYETWNAENWVFFNGGNVIGADGRTVGIDKPAAYNGLQFAADLVNKHGVAPNAAELAGRPPTDLFMQGIVNMYMVGGWYVANFADGIKDFTYQTVGPPRLARRTSKLEISGYAITKQSKNPEAAWEYIKFITGPAGQLIWSLVGMPSRQSVINQFLAGKGPGGKYAKYYKPFIQSLPSVQWTPFIKQSPQVGQELTTGLDPVWAGDETAKDACAGIAAKIRKLLA